MTTLPADQSGAPAATEPILEAMGITPPRLAALDDIPAATHWPSVPASQAANEWVELREWVDRLQRRFAHLDHHVIPPCWWRHNEHVEALVALRDHERVSFLACAPATAPLEWMRALRDIVGLLRSWTAEHPCGASHHDVPLRQGESEVSGWDDYVAADLERRRRDEPGRTRTQ